MDFDDMNDTTTITADSVSAAEALIDDGLSADLSLLDEEMTVTITFGEDIEAATRSLEGSKKRRHLDREERLVPIGDFHHRYPAVWRSSLHVKIKDLPVERVIPVS